MSVKGPGLRPTYEAPGQFASWLEATTAAWPFEHLCSAHNGVLRGNANQRVQALLKDSQASKNTCKQ